MKSVQLETEAAVQDVVTQETRLARFFQRLFKAIVNFENLAMNVVVANAAAHGVGGNGHAFNDNMRIEAQNIAIFERARFTFVGITHQIFLARQIARHEAPLQAGGETGTAATAQTGSLDLFNDFIGCHARRQNFAQSLVPTPGHVIFKPPVCAIQACHDLRADMATMENHTARHIIVRRNIQAFRKFLQNSGGAHCAPPFCFSSLIMASIFSGIIRTHMCLLLTSMTGESPHAPMHSPSTSEKRPSSVVS